MSLQAIDQEVTEAVTVMTGAKALIIGLAAEIRANAGNPAALKALADKLDAQSNDLAAAVLENTPAPPEPPLPA